MRLQNKSVLLLKTLEDHLKIKIGCIFIGEIKDKIRNAEEKTIDYIGDNLLEITIEELKEILR